MAWVIVRAYLWRHYTEQYVSLRKQQTQASWPGTRKGSPPPTHLFWLSGTVFWENCNNSHNVASFKALQREMPTMQAKQQHTGDVTLTLSRGQITRNRPSRWLFFPRWLSFWTGTMLSQVWPLNMTSLLCLLRPPVTAASDWQIEHENFAVLRISLICYNVTGICYKVLDLLTSRPCSFLWTRRLYRDTLQSLCDVTPRTQLHHVRPPYREITCL